MDATSSQNWFDGGVLRSGLVRECLFVTLAVVTGKRGRRQSIITI